MTLLLLRGLAALFQTLPETAALALGRGLGRCAHAIARSRRRIALAGLRQALGATHDDATLRAICRANFAHYGTVLAEVLRLPRLTDGQLLDRFTLTGCEHHTRALARGRGVIVITAHLGNWEYLVAAQQAWGLDMAVITRHAHHGGVDRFWQGMREARGVRCLDSYRSLKDVVRHLERGGTVGMTIDQNEGGTTAPVGLEGELMTRRRVRGVTAASRSWRRGTKPAPAAPGTRTGRPPASFACSGNDTQQGVGRTTSSPSSSRASMT